MSFTATRYFKPKILRLGQLSGVLHALVSQYKHKPDAARIGINQWFSDDSSQSQEKVPLTALDPICDIGNRYTVQLAFYDEIGKTAGLRHIGLHISQRFFEVFIATETSQELEKLFDFLINELALETTESPRERMLRLLDELLTSEQAKVPSNARPTTAHDVQQRILVFLVELERLMNGNPVEDTLIAERLYLDPRHVQMHLELLEMDGCVDRWVSQGDGRGSMSVVLKALGRVRAEDPEYLPRNPAAYTTNISTGGGNAVFTGGGDYAGNDLDKRQISRNENQTEGAGATEALATKSPPDRNQRPRAKKQRQRPKRTSRTRPGKLLTLSIGHEVWVTTPNVFQFHKIGRTFPVNEPWTGTDEDRQSFEQWMRKVLPFITCEIDQEELAERRAEMQALETPLPNDDKLAYVAYVCINHPDDLQQIVEALLPPLRRA